MTTILETPRLRLREFVPEDAEALAAVISDPQTMRFYPAPFTRSQVEEWIDRNRQRYEKDKAGLWAVILKSTGTLIGDCGIIRQEVDGEFLYEVGYHLHRDHWGQGLATEAAVACRHWAFANLKVDRVVSLIRPENLPSRKVAERNGMKIWKEVDWRGLHHYVYAIERSDVSKTSSS